MINKKPNFSVRTLGECKIDSPITLSTQVGDFKANYVEDSHRVLHQVCYSQNNDNLKIDTSNSFEKAGPRKKIFFDPSKVKAAVVTCGGLCPGLNDVIRTLVLNLYEQYKVLVVYGIRFGYRGLLPHAVPAPVIMTPKMVEGIHLDAGTILGSSRGSGEKTEQIVDTLEKLGVNILFTIGGDGTQRGALAIEKEIAKRKLKISVIGIPKTIDNDLSYADRSFGFDSAVSIATQAIAAAHVEASDAPNGIGLVKVMGRHSGFIAAHAALAMDSVDFVLIPEVPFDIEGEKGFLSNLEECVLKKGWAVVLVAEGAGVQQLDDTEEKDASGNKLLADVGLYLKQRISTWFAQRKIEANLKYIDPSYIIRAAPANANDSLLCARLATAAIHAAMAGKTGILVNLINGQYSHIPIELAAFERNQVNPDGSLWSDVVEATGQPALMKN